MGLSDGVLDRGRHLTHFRLSAGACSPGFGLLFSGLCVYRGWVGLNIRHCINGKIIPGSIGSTMIGLRLGLSISLR